MIATWMAGSLMDFPLMAEKTESLLILQLLTSIAGITG
jgi:hypothetical protein